jgi:broad specificity phosphatase PhoE
VVDWPKTLWIARHAESTGNVARDIAEASGAEHIEIAERDMDVPLSSAGQAQAFEFAGWVSSFPQRPTVVLSSPQQRAFQTASPIAALIADVRDRAPIIDERLREKELGALDRLTHAGVAARFPAEVSTRTRVGKFYYRPPGGESWCDVVQRVRGVVGDIQRLYANEHVLVVTHQVVISSFRYVLDRLTEAQLLALGYAGEVGNASITLYDYDATAWSGRGGMTLRSYNQSAKVI